MKAGYNPLGQLVSEMWYDSSETLTAHYRYTYDHQGNIVRSVDILAKKEYNYSYEEGRLLRATECDITLDEATDMVTAKTLVNTLRYYYDSEGNLTRKVRSPHTGPRDVRYYENEDEQNTVVQVLNTQRCYTSHSKTDSFGRKVFDEIQTGRGSIHRQFLYAPGEANEVFTTAEDYGRLKSAPTTQLVKQIILSDGRTISYEYDAEDRITRVEDSLEGITQYTYDAQGQLLTETRNNVVVNVMTYDKYGNILTKNGKSYDYESGDNAWKDKLIRYNGETISYDAQGNPTSYLGSTLVWEKGRQLKSFGNNVYTYNASGIRTSKTVGGIKHTYTLDGAKILREQWVEGEDINREIVPLYDNEDNVCGILYGDIPYYFLKNLQGDVIAITNQRGETVARYTYDAWGACTISYDATATPTVEGGEAINIATVNPFRYRSYYFDTETGLYYLRSRYYDPALGRFVNGDDAVAALIASTEVRPNFYLYCNNNAVSMTDPTGFMTAAAIAVNFVSAAGYAGVANSWNVVGWVILAVVLVVIIAICIWNIAKAVKNAKKNAQVKAALLLNFASTAATPPPPNKGGKGTKVTSRTLYNKNGVHIDVENPGNRKGQIHLQKGNQKYIYNIQKQAFYNTKTGLKAPKAIQDLLLLPEVIEAIAKGLQYLGYFL